MRISLTLLFAVVLQLSAANGYAQRIRGVISMNNVSIEQVLNKIEESSDYVFLYNDKAIQKNRIVSVNNNSGKIRTFWMKYSGVLLYLIRWWINRLFFPQNLSCKKQWKMRLFP